MGFEKIKLGRTGLPVTRLGIGSSYGTDEAMVEEAVEHGVNYLYWGAMKTKKMAAGIKKVIRGNRDKIVIVAQAMTYSPTGMSSVVRKILKNLGVDYLDVLLLGWRNKKIPPRMIEQFHKLKNEGLVHFLAISSHKRLIFPEIEQDKQADIIHVRYNASHRGAEKEVFDRLPDEGGPGVVSFTNTRWSSLINPAYMPPGEPAPSATDCYRFVLSHPKVHLAVCGPSSLDNLRENLKALEFGPMNEEELDRMRRIGDFVYKNVSPVKAQLKSMRTIRWRSK
jgi:aryl-alcohol dehydrogenase-like predicted oxidoreductase